MDLLLLLLLVHRMETTHLMELLLLRLLLVHRMKITDQVEVLLLRFRNRHLPDQELGRYHLTDLLLLLLLISQVLIQPCLQFCKDCNAQKRLNSLSQCLRANQPASKWPRSRKRSQQLTTNHFLEDQVLIPRCPLSDSNLPIFPLNRCVFSF